MPSKKSAIMHVTPSRQQSNLVASGIMWNGVNVPEVDKYCYLGLWFQNNCSWNVHFEEVMKKVERRKNMHVDAMCGKIVISVLR
jgi:hypothetical protein